jgi:hypothetical protein
MRQRLGVFLILSKDKSNPDMMSTSNFDRVPDRISFSAAVSFLRQAYRALLLPLSQDKNEESSLSYDEARSLIMASDSQLVLKAIHSLKAKLLTGIDQDIRLESYEVANSLAVEVQEMVEHKRKMKQQKYGERPERTRAHHYHNSERAETTS